MFGTLWNKISVAHCGAESALHYLILIFLPLQGR